MTPLQLFKCLADETRLRCVTLLQNERRLCVCEITEALQLSQPKVSRHLAALRNSGLLLDSREGQWVFYQIHPELAEPIQDLLHATLTAVLSTEQYRIDRERLKAMANRPEQTICCGSG